MARAARAPSAEPIARRLSRTACCNCRAGSRTSRPGSATCSSRACAPTSRKTRAMCRRVDGRPSPPRAPTSILRRARVSSGSRLATQRKLRDLNTSRPAFQAINNDGANYLPHPGHPGQCRFQRCAIYIGGCRRRHSVGNRIPGMLGPVKPSGCNWAELLELLGQMSEAPETTGLLRGRTTAPYLTPSAAHRADDYHRARLVGASNDALPAPRPHPHGDRAGAGEDGAEGDSYATGGTRHAERQDWQRHGHC